MITNGLEDQTVQHNLLKSDRVTNLTLIQKEPHSLKTELTLEAEATESRYIIVSCIYLGWLPPKIKRLTFCIKSPHDPKFHNIKFKMSKLQSKILHRIPQKFKSAKKKKKSR